MAYGRSNDDVIDDVTWPLEFKVVILISLRPVISYKKFTWRIYALSERLLVNFWCEYRSWPWLEKHKRNFDRSKFKVTRDISPTISGWFLVVQMVAQQDHFESICIHFFQNNGVQFIFSVSQNAEFHPTFCYTSQGICSISSKSEERPSLDWYQTRGKALKQPGHSIIPHWEAHTSTSPFALDCTKCTV